MSRNNEQADAAAQILIRIVFSKYFGSDTEKTTKVLYPLIIENP